MNNTKERDQTRENIIATAAEMFVEKGYEKTSIQDILKVLGLSKGGLYHHFGSKEEILTAVLEQRTQHSYQVLREATQQSGSASAKEQLNHALRTLAQVPDVHAVRGDLQSRANDPRFVVDGMRGTLTHDAPLIAEVIEKGVADGSIDVANAEFCAEVFLLLLNFWTNPVLFARGEEETKLRLEYVGTLMRSIGLDVMDAELVGLILASYERVGAFRELTEEA